MMRQPWLTVPNLVSPTLRPRLRSLARRGRSCSTQDGDRTATPGGNRGMSDNHPPVRFLGEATGPDIVIVAEHVIPVESSI